MSRPRVAVIVQARTSSRRLPGKVLKPLAGRPALLRMMDRVARVGQADSVLVATSVEPGDDVIAELCSSAGIRCVRGPLDDVLARFVLAVPAAHDVVVRLTADCPLVDPALVDRHVERFLAAGPDTEYVTNAVERTMPDGLDVEVLSRRALERAHDHAVEAYDREHVTPWIRRHARALHVTQPVDLSALRWTLDTAADLESIATVYDELLEPKPRFDKGDVYRLLLRRPELIRVAGAETLGEPERARWRARIREHLATVGGQDDE